MKRLLAVVLLMLSSVSWVQAQDNTPTPNPKCAQELGHSDMNPYNEDSKGLARNAQVTVTNASDPSHPECIVVVKFESDYMVGGKVGRVYELVSASVPAGDTVNLDVPLPDCQVALSLSSNGEEVDTKQLTKGADCGDRAAEIEDCDASRDMSIDSIEFADNKLQVDLVNASNACSYEGGFAVYGKKGVLLQSATDELGPGNNQSFEVDVPSLKGDIIIYTGETSPSEVKGGYAHRTLAQGVAPFAPQADACTWEDAQIVCPVG